MSIQQDNFVEIADAIRNAINTTDLIKPSDFAELIPTVYSQGETDGIEIGKQNQSDLFWESFQNGGNATEYSYAFYSTRFNDETFKPKYNIVTTNAQYMFRNSAITDIGQRLIENGVTLDTSQATSLDYAFYYAKGKIPTISTINCSTLLATFCGNTFHTIEKLILKSDGSQNFTSTFNDAGELQNIAFEGVIGKSINFGSSIKLTHDSLINIINTLKDYSGTGTTPTLTLGTTNIAKLTTEEIAIATQKGWTTV